MLRTEFFYMVSKVMPTIENEYEFLTVYPTCLS
ncbi:MAG: hypothetical protein KKH91_04415 [Elusimicrobia bacterium]|nr:hypothetical protein [Elusimicrobiota bacterium]MBU2614178.1 hypothetical protein [Elusimicrobiota bacterium]